MSDIKASGWGSPETQKRWWTARRAYNAAHGVLDPDWHDLSRVEREVWWLIVGAQS